MVSEQLPGMEIDRRLFIVEKRRFDQIGFRSVFLHFAVKIDITPADL